jgi:hypothetical protein
MVIQKITRTPRRHTQRRPIPNDSDYSEFRPSYFWGLTLRTLKGRSSDSIDGAQRAAMTSRTAEIGATFTRHCGLNFIFVEGVHKRIFAIDHAKNVLVYPFDKIRYEYTKIGLKMLLYRG